MIEIQAPNKRPLWNSQETLFLAGSIEMGKAENWQTRFMQAVDHWPVTVFNPRRDDWNPNWEQSIDNLQFAEQVNWELDHLTLADWVVFYFDPATQSPITLMELGIMASLPKSKGWYSRQRRVTVCCPPGFWRKGNVDIICKRAQIPVFKTLEELIADFLKVEE